jgi:hypothetical protein
MFSFPMTRATRRHRDGRRASCLAVAFSVLSPGCDRLPGEKGESAAPRIVHEVIRPFADADGDRRVPAAPARDTAVNRPLPESSSAPVKTDDVRVVPFAWRPPGASAEAYAMDEAEDQHRIVLLPKVANGASYPVLVAFHGQPKRGEAPRHYAFAARVIEVATRALERGEIRPTVLVLPVFRYVGSNWPLFDVASFRNEVDRRLAGHAVKAADYYVVGHSGAAGCGGDGMNRAHRMRPAAVGFFDTCLGRGWREEVTRLREARIPTLMIHSLETAAFSPRQPTEYSPTFDFGRAYGPAGLSPVDCPAELPRAPLRTQPYRCSADEQQITRGFIIDSGVGEEGHNAVVPIALEYFLKQFLGSR